MNAEQPEEMQRPQHGEYENERNERELLQNIEELSIEEDDEEDAPPRGFCEWVMFILKWYYEKFITDDAFFEFNVIFAGITLILTIFVVLNQGYRHFYKTK